MGISVSVVIVLTHFRSVKADSDLDSQTVRIVDLEDGSGVVIDEEIVLVYKLVLFAIGELSFVPVLADFLDSMLTCIRQPFIDVKENCP